ncbi:MAG: hypothetical protein R2848_11100 [Thermomicrobiales bacterium]
MNAKSPAQRAFFLSAGIIMNILFAIFPDDPGRRHQGRATQPGLHRGCRRGIAGRDSRVAGW